MYRFKDLIILTFAILLLAHHSFALYKDQAGVIDWYALQPIDLII